MRWWLVVMLLAGVACSKSEPDRCEKAVRHVIFGVGPTQGPGAPAGDEKKMMESIAKMGIKVCREEGLTQAQADCIFAIESVDDLLTVGRCPAIAENKPSWLQVPSEVDLEKLEKARSQSGD